MDALTNTADAAEKRAEAPTANPSFPTKPLTGSRGSTTEARARDAGAGTGLLAADPLDRFIDRPARHAVAARAWSRETIDGSS
jgi:hypothetical protein